MIGRWPRACSRRRSAGTAGVVGSPARSVAGAVHRRRRSWCRDAPGRRPGEKLAAGVRADGQARRRPRRVARSTCRPSGEATRARRSISPSTRRACAAIGVRHEPSSAASNARSAATQRKVGASSSRASRSRVRGSSARHSMPMAPCATAGSISSTASGVPPAMAEPEPRRARPPRAASPRPRPPRAWQPRVRHCRAAA